MKKYIMIGSWCTTLLAGSYFLVLLLLQQVRASNQVSFKFRNDSDNKVYVHEFIVLESNQRPAKIGVGGKRGITGNRRLNSPAHFLASPAKFAWALDEHVNWKSPYSGPSTEANICRQTVNFPAFDQKALKWTSFWTLQPNNRWVGEFHGVQLKPPGKQLGAEQAKQVGNWLQIQFRNNYEKPVRLHDSRFLKDTGDVSPKIEFTDVPNDGHFHGCTVYCSKESNFRLGRDEKLHFEWLGVPTPSDRKNVQSVQMPTFDPSQKFWFIYLTLEKDGSWSVEFEGAINQK